LEINPVVYKARNLYWNSAGRNIGSKPSNSREQREKTPKLYALTLLFSKNGSDSDLICNKSETTWHASAEYHQLKANKMQWKNNEE